MGVSSTGPPLARGASHLYLRLPCNRPPPCSGPLPSTGVCPPQSHPPPRVGMEGIQGRRLPDPPAGPCLAGGGREAGGPPQDLPAGRPGAAPPLQTGSPGPLAGRPSAGRGEGPGVARVPRGLCGPPAFRGQKAPIDSGRQLGFEGLAAVSFFFFTAAHGKTSRWSHALPLSHAIPPSQAILLSRF